jgi:hypothetical protein
MLFPAGRAQVIRVLSRLIGCARPEDAACLRAAKAMVRAYSPTARASGEEPEAENAQDRMLRAFGDDPLDGLTALPPIRRGRDLRRGDELRIQES